MVPDEGIEPPTFGLQNRCSTAELIRRRANPRGIGYQHKAGLAICFCTLNKKGPAKAGPFSSVWAFAAYSPAKMSRSLVSGRKIRPMTKVMSATTIGYQRPAKISPEAATMAKAVGGRKPPNQPLPIW